MRTRVYISGGAYTRIHIHFVQETGCDDWSSGNGAICIRFGV